MTGFERWKPVREWTPRAQLPLRGSRWNGARPRRLVRFVQQGQCSGDSRGFPVRWWPSAILSKASRKSVTGFEKRKPPIPSRLIPPGNPVRYCPFVLPNRWLPTFPSRPHPAVNKRESFAMPSLRLRPARLRGGTPPSLRGAQLPSRAAGVEHGAVVWLAVCCKESIVQ